MAMSNERRAPASWPTDDMVVSGAEVIHDSLRMFGIDINLDTGTTGTEIQQEIVEAVFNAMLTAAPKAEQPPVQEPVACISWSNDEPEWKLKMLAEPAHPPVIPLKLYAAPQPVSDDARDALVEALEVLAKLGNGEHYGNSDGNVIAQRALAAYRAAMESK